MLNDYVLTDDEGWALPDLAFGGEAWAVVRLRVPSFVSAGVVQGEVLAALCSFSMRYTTLDGEPRAIQPTSLALPALPASAFAAIAEDELVVRRADELEAAHLQQKARTAARRRDWDGVAAALKKAERIAADNPWVAASLNELRELAAQKDEVSFAKEAMFASRKMSTRLAGSYESLDDKDVPAASYLRRKSSQGKADRKPPQA
jgi:Ca-activated chloride channel family protein